MYHYIAPIKSVSVHCSYKKCISALPVYLFIYDKEKYFFGILYDPLRLPSQNLSQAKAERDCNKPNRLVSVRFCFSPLLFQIKTLANSVNVN